MNEAVNDAEEITEANDLANLLMQHKRIADGGGLRCSCGYRYRLGEFIYEHRAEVVMAAGWRR